LLAVRLLLLPPQFLTLCLPLLSLFLHGRLREPVEEREAHRVRKAGLHDVDDDVELGPGHALGVVDAGRDVGQVNERGLHVVLVPGHEIDRDFNEREDLNVAALKRAARFVDLVQRDRHVARRQLPPGSLGVRRLVVALAREQGPLQSALRLGGRNEGDGEGRIGVVECKLEVSVQLIGEKEPEVLLPRSVLELRKRGEEKRG